jgi:Ran GTPase-activating protein (RanGAP) involved in mRNA processing and transport
VSPSSLNALYLGGNAIGPSGLHALVRGLHAAPALETLWLAGNALDSEALSAFAPVPGGPSACGALTHLAIQDNRIGDDGLAALAEALSHGALPRLRWLYAGQNGFGDAGVAALAGALRRGACTALTRLGLQANSVGDAGLSALGDALQTGAMSEAEFIYLAGNPFTSDGREALTRILAGSSLQIHFGWPPPRTKSFLITPPDRLAPDEQHVYEPTSYPPGAAAAASA